MTYALYTFSAENLPRNHSMMLTIPVVLYGLFRYLFLVREGEIGGTPEELLFRGPTAADCRRGVGGALGGGAVPRPRHVTHRRSGAIQTNRHAASTAQATPDAIAASATSLLLQAAASPPTKAAKALVLATITRPKRRRRSPLARV